MGEVHEEDGQRCFARLIAEDLTRLYIGGDDPIRCKRVTGIHALGSNTNGL